MKCEAWIGLEPPESVDCELNVDHEPPHISIIRVSQRCGPGEYRTIEAVLSWPFDGC